MPALHVDQIITAEFSIVLIDFRKRSAEVSIQLGLKLRDSYVHEQDRYIQLSKSFHLVIR
jgi:hypothetical protein